MGFFANMFGSNADRQAQEAKSAQRQADIVRMLRSGSIPSSMQARLDDVRSGKAPWIATLTPAELRITRSHGIKPIAAIAATCWLHYGSSWTLEHRQGWQDALTRLRREAIAAGANAILDVKMRTVSLRVENSMDFTLVGTAVSIAGLPHNSVPIVATVPALEFVKLLEANIVPTGIAIGAHYEWLTDYYGNSDMRGYGNTEADQLSQFLQRVRQQAYSDLRNNARSQGNGVLAHVNFHEIFQFEEPEQPKRYLGRHITVATTVDAGTEVEMVHDVDMVVDMCAGRSPLTFTRPHHQSYSSQDREGAI